ncbi:MAG: lysophospholipid acyltransferase family protein [candidate division KSB1 bacterium]
MRTKLFKLSDLYHAASWLLTRIGYSLFPLLVLNRYATLKGRIKALTSEERFTVKKNLVTTFGETHSEKDIDEIVRRYFEFAVKFEMLLRALPLKGCAALARCPVEGLHHLDAALAQGRGVILVSAHFGYARLVEYILKMKNYKIRVVRSRSEMMNHAEKRQKKLSEGLTAFAGFMHRRLQTPILVAEERELFAGINVRPLVKALNQNDVLYLMGDGTRAMKFVTLDFLGFQLPFPTGYLNVALATGAVVLPVFAVDAANRYGIKLIIEKPLVLVQEEPPSPKAVNSNVESFARAFEAYVQRYPHLYKMFSSQKKFERRLARSRGEVAERYIPGRRRSNEKFSESEK